MRLRLRHAKGVSTLEIGDDLTVQDLLHQIHQLADILPSRQSLKCGYPPRQLTLVPELPLSSLGLVNGDQIIVSELAAPPPSAPAAPIAPDRPTAAASGPDSVQVDGSFLIHRIVPDDNSCLFSAVALLFEQDIANAPRLRKIVADAIRNDPDKYSEAILGMPPAQYITTILKPATWGGAIELTVLAAHYNTEIASVDVESGRIDHFTPPPASDTSPRAIVIYSGIHYDAATLAPSPDAPSEWHQTVFPAISPDDADPVLRGAKHLAQILREKKAFTNTATFDLKCEDCGQGLKGEKGARQHAEQTGHVRFGEY
ncbi:hypothetical protein BD779DRAFT_1509184 [Infundibulicybe gibba]|nr:hypothetical protein BD779DRAFT_1509184 [Infundibulicybe gibba]